MTALSVLAAVAALVYAGVNAFGFWMVRRRKPWVAYYFLVATISLVLASLFLFASLPYARQILAAGVMLASVASFLNAHIVLGNVVWRFHVLRAAIGTVLYLLAHWGFSR